MNGLVQQLPALIGVLVGALGSFAVVTMTERAARGRRGDPARRPRRTALPRLPHTTRTTRARRMTTRQATASPSQHRTHDLRLILWLLTHSRSTPRREDGRPGHDRQPDPTDRQPR